jgi:pre-mRNA-processing factor 19
MSMICAISQQTPDEPVISPLSGCVFEKRLIQKYISEYGKDPVTNEPLREEQLVEIKQFQKVVKPKLPSVTSIPDLLGQLRNEWDACMLDSYELKDDLLKTKRELSHALYQLEASYRVIARLKNQVDELQLKLRQENEPAANGEE